MTISRTARVLASRRALAFENNSGIGADQFAKFFTDEETMDFARTTDQPIHNILLRYQVIDNFFKWALPKVDQIIILGAGFDTKYQRYRVSSTVNFIEVDRENLQSAKASILKEQSLPIPNMLSTDINNPQLFAQLLKSFNPDRNMLISGEGLFYYLEKDTFISYLHEILTYFKADIFLAFDMLRPAYFQSQHGKNTVERIGKHGEYILFGMSEKELTDTVASVRNDLSVKIWNAPELAKLYLDKEFTSEIENYFVTLYPTKFSFNG